jgi:anti-anti-sigma factor
MPSEPDPDHAGPDRLQVRPVPRAGGAELELSGELTLATVTRAEDGLTEAERSRPALLVLDLRRVRFMDSTGLAALVAAQKRGRRDGRRLIVVMSPGAVERLLTLTGLDRQLEIVVAPPEATRIGVPSAR